MGVSLCFLFRGFRLGAILGMACALTACKSSPQSTPAQERRGSPSREAAEGANSERSAEQTEPEAGEVAGGEEGPPDPSEAPTPTAEEREQKQHLCQAPVLFLAHHESIESTRTLLCKEPPHELSSTAREEPIFTAPVTAWRVEHSAPCRELEFAHHALRAWHGQPVEDEQWRGYLEAKYDWYGQRPETSPSEVGAANMKALEEQIEACWASSEVVATDKELVGTWFAELHAGRTPELPNTLFVDGQEASEDDFMSFVYHGSQGPSDRYYAYTVRDPIRVGPCQNSLEVPGAERCLWLSPGSTPLLDRYECRGEGCEGYEWIQFFLDAQGELVGASVTAVACPFVYLRRGEGWAYQGEILRELRRPSLEGAQTLALELDAQSCPSRAGQARVRVELAEEKREITHLDAVALELADGRRVLPDACEAGGALAFCRRDGVRAVLEQGDTLELSFTIEPDDCEGRVRLWASGYYVPGEGAQ